MSNLPVAIVTGSAKRLGAAIIEAIHANQYNIIIHYRHSENEAKTLCEACNNIRTHSAITLQADLNHFETYTTLIATAQQHWGRLDVLVNNASEYFPTSIGTATEQQWNDLINSNLKAPYFLSQAAIPYLQQSKGCIINISDVNGVKPLKCYPIYCTAKAGLNMLTRSLAKELAPDIRVNAVAPGPTRFSSSRHQEQTALKRVAEPEEIADAVLFLIQHHYITGEILNVAGGKLL